MAICKRCEIDTKGTVVNLLNQILADIFVLYVKVLNFHWNVIGPHFNHIHTMLGAMYTAIGLSIDSLAEHIRSMDAKPLATMSEFLAGANNVTEESPSDCSDRNLVGILSRDFKEVTDYISLVVNHIDDEFKADRNNRFFADSTLDMLTALLQEFEKHTWMLKSSKDG